MANSALLVMDVQQMIVDRFGGGAEYLPRVREAIDAARAAGIPVIYAVVGFRAGFPEVSTLNKTFGALNLDPPMSWVVWGTET
jgi:nicotinamidase-related amidase